MFSVRNKYLVLSLAIAVCILPASFSMAQIKPKPIGGDAAGGKCAKDPKKNVCLPNNGACGKYLDEKCNPTNEEIPCEYTEVRCMTCQCLIGGICSWQEKGVSGSMSCACATDQERFGKCQLANAINSGATQNGILPICTKSQEGKVDYATCALKAFDAQGKAAGKTNCSEIKDPKATPPCAATPVPNNY
jgi:hypothetical protein